MSRKKPRPIYAADFETSVYKGQTATEVWAAAWVQTGTEAVTVVNSIDRFFKFLLDDEEKLVYFHNLKFDGAFILDALARRADFKPALTYDESGYPHFKDKKEMCPGEYRYIISDMGAWYLIEIVTDTGKYIEIRDSLKLLPFTLKKIGKDFKTKHQKLEMDYEGERHAGGEILEHEKEYIQNDVLVLKEALELMLEGGLSKLTIGSCCMSEFKKLNFGEFDTLFPDPSKIPVSGIHADVEGDTLYDWIHKAYRGGWVYTNPRFQRSKQGFGMTADVNSLYPSVMHTVSGNPYPVGKPKWFIGEKPKHVTPDKWFIYVRFKCRFRLRDGFLPFVQIKHSFLYDGRKMLSTNVVFDRRTQTWHDDPVELTMPLFEYDLLIKHYEIFDLEWIDGCYFAQVIGLFDPYIDKWMQVKMTSTGAVRAQSKLMLNNLYGKFATSPYSNFKVGRLKDDTMKYECVPDKSMKGGYLPIGAAVTAYARRFTITAAQLNYNRFCYADTDSIHCIGDKPLKGVNIDPVKMLHWKIESVWDYAYFTRAKTYIEHAVEIDEKPVDEFIIKCAGLPQYCKKLLEHSLRGTMPTPKEQEKMELEDILFCEDHRTVEDFDTGLCVPGKLRPKTIPGGVILERCYFEIS